MDETLIMHASQLAAELIQCIEEGNPCASCLGFDHKHSRGCSLVALIRIPEIADELVFDGAHQDG